MINKTYKNCENIAATPAKLRNGSSNLPDRSVPKGSAQSQTSQLYSQISRLVPATEKYKKPVKKVNEMLLKSRTYS